MTYRAVLFDLGYTLLDIPLAMTWREFVERRLAEMYDTVCSLVRIPPVEPHEFATKMADVIGGEEARSLERSGVSWRMADRVRRGLETLEAECSDAAIERITSEFFVPGRLDVRCYPETVDVLGKLTSAGIARAIVSNTPWDAPGILTHRDMERCGIAHYFEVVIASGDVPWRKPNPEFMFEAARRLEVEPADCLVVGDSLRADIAGARAAGMRSAWVRRDATEMAEDDPQPDEIVVSLSELSVLKRR
jgi:HAD superfamily hydrolase (TIGR01509 family)